MPKITIPFTGGCACGAIRYECTAEPIMMLKCHCRDCQHVTGDGFAAAVVCRLNRSGSRADNCVTISRKALRAANINAVSVPTVAHGSPERNRNQTIHRTSEYSPAASMIQAGFARRWIFSCPTLNRGIRWIPRFRNSKSTRQRQQTNRDVFMDVPQ